MTRTDQLPAVDDVTGWFADVRALMTPALTEAVSQLGPIMRRICSYQLGWIDERGRPTAGLAGKAVRPALLLASAEAVGGSIEAAVPAAVAVELLHNCTLLQDDVMDEDVTRRHRPTAWTLFGKSEAVLAGDSLMALAFAVLATSGREHAGAAARELARTTHELIEGQAMDIGFERMSAVSLDDVVRMSGAKTASLLGCACGIGGRWFGADEQTCAALTRFGRQLGMAYQLRDDLLGIWGDPKRTGKAVLADLGRRKKSLPVVAALTAENRCAQALRSLYDRPDQLTEAEAAEAAELVERAGGRAWAERAASEAMAAAEHELEQLARSGVATARLAALGRFLVGRDR